MLRGVGRQAARLNRRRQKKKKKCGKVAASRGHVPIYAAVTSLHARAVYTSNRRQRARVTRPALAACVRAALCMSFVCAVKFCCTLVVGDVGMWCVGDMPSGGPGETLRPVGIATIMCEVCMQVGCSQAPVCCMEGRGFTPEPCS